jgi:hypothetical protein
MKLLKAEIYRDGGSLSAEVEHACSVFCLFLQVKPWDDPASPREYEALAIWDRTQEQHPGDAPNAHRVPTEQRRLSLDEEVRCLIALQDVDQTGSTEDDRKRFNDLRAAVRARHPLVRQLRARLAPPWDPSIGGL